MKKERALLPLGKILLNEGQLGWLPRNPRSWTQTDIDKTAKSILEDQDFLEDRPILVVPFNEGVYIAFAGNLRHEGASATKKVKKVPCVIYYPETAEDYETVKRRAIKDNGSFGKWDYDTLANKWGDLQLTDWGVPAWEPEEVKMPGEKEDLSDKIDFQYKIEVECVTEAEQEALYNKLMEEGYKCRILTL